MPTEQFANNATTTLNGAISSTSATSITVASASAFPSVAQFRILIESEIMLVTAGAGSTTWTVTRGIEGTTAATHADGATVRQILTAGALKIWTPSQVIAPRHHGLKAWNYDPGTTSSSSANVSGTIYAQKIYLPEDMPITNIVLVIGTAGATLTSGQSLVGLYSQTGTQIGVSADQSANWTSSGVKTIALTSGPFSVSGGPDNYCYVLVMCNGTTPAAFTRASANFNAGNVGLAAADGFRFGVQGTSQTALPSSFTVSSLTTTNALCFWVGLS